MVSGITAAVLAAVAAACVGGGARAAVRGGGGSELVVTTPFGDVQGKLSLGEQAREFHGLPYAVPPVGDLRWTDPVMTPPYGQSPLDATRPGPGCLQRCGEPYGGCPPAGVSEDCLTLNVFTPRAPGGAAPAAPHPVLVFVHGGNFKDGSGSALLYSGRYIANATGTVVVTINYRLGAAGFITNSDAGLTGNYGFKDQVMALRWVQKAIASFGGDPARVTLMGQSAGAVSVLIHRYSPLSRGLFHQCFVESSLSGLPLRAQADADNVEKAFAKQAGCNYTDTACLRAVNATRLLAAQDFVYTDIGLDALAFLEAFMPFSPTVSPDVMPLQPFVGSTNKSLVEPMPTIIGNVRNEGNLFINSGFRKPVPSLEYLVLIGVVVGNLGLAAEITALYPIPPGTGNDTRPVMSDVTSDGVFFCPARQTAWSFSDGAPVYRYLYDHVYSDAHALYDQINATFCDDVVCHGQDIPFMTSPLLEFSSGAGGHPVYTWTDDERALAHLNAGMIGNFVHTGNPNKGPVAVPVEWPAFTRDSNASLRINAPVSEVITDWRTAECDVWDKVGYPFP